MRQRNLTREEAIEKYLIYRRRIHELLDLAKIARDIRAGRYTPQDCVGRGPERFSLAVGNAIMGLFASLLDPQNHALNVFDVWVALFPERRRRIAKTWEKVKPHVQLIRNYRNDIACHANKSLRRYAETYLKHHRYLDEIAAAMQEVSRLAADLIRDESTANPNLRAEAGPIVSRALAPIVRKLGPTEGPVVHTELRACFLQD